MKKRIAALCLALVLLFPSVCAHAASTPLLYRVTDDMGHEIYLFGTIHVGNAALYPLSDAVMDAFATCDALAVEVDLLSAMENPAELVSYSAQVYCTGDETAQDHLGEDVVRMAADALDMDERLLSVFRPYGILSLLEEKSIQDALLSSEHGVDMYLMRQAREKGMPVVELESLEEQFSLLFGMSDAFTSYQIQMYALYPQQAALSTLMLLNAWKTGDRAALRLLLESDMDTTGLDSSLVAEMEAFDQKMYGDRDLAFTLQAQDFLYYGEKVFFAVGAAHVAGEGGMVDLLEAMGYTVEEIGH